MKQRKAMLLKLAILGVLGAAVLISLMLPSSSLFASSKEVVEISVIARDEDPSHWENMKMGMEQAAQEAGAELRFLYLSRPNNESEQVDVMRREVERGAQVLIVAPASDACIETFVQEVGKIPVITMESCSPAAAAWVAPDQTALGTAMAQAILDDGVPQNVLLLDTAEENSAVSQRIDAVDAALKEQGVETARMRIAARELVSQTFLWAQQIYDVVVTAEPAAAEAAVKKKIELKLPQRLYGVGMTDTIALALEDETLSACAVIGEYAAGYLAVQQALGAAQGKTAQSQTMPFLIIRGEDLNALDIQKLLFAVD